MLISLLLFAIGWKYAIIIALIALGFTAYVAYAFNSIVEDKELTQNMSCRDLKEKIAIQDFAIPKSQLNAEHLYEWRCEK
ncbi:hypothetical protein LCGC14_2857950 [marine sediment metagenome]|uniref:Uncharacterized protein n=1 Tax=marine sediment metagenome TaxID=412755 RepID=A0A0F9AEX9_9ZZZZ|nr:hypothetical protein [bacterium]